MQIVSVSIIGILLQAAIAVVMIKRNLRAQFPSFFTYTIFQVISSSVLLFLYVQHQSYATYFYTYWTSVGLSILLGFVVLYEVFMYTIRPYTGLRDLARIIFRWTALILVVMAALVAFSGKPSGMDQITMAISNVERSVRLMQVGLLVFLFLCSSQLGVNWRSFPFGIALGFGLFASVDLVGASLLTQVGRNWGKELGNISLYAYFGSVLLWTSYSLLRQPARERIEMAYSPAIDRWNQAALALSEGAAAPADPTYLSDLERTVDQILRQSKPSEI